MVKTLAVMTSGGDAPGMNAAVRAVVRRALDNSLTVFGIYNGYEGLVAGGDAIRPLTWDAVGGLLQKGGTFLGTARSERFRSREGRRQAVLNLLQHGIQALVVIGGDGSLSGASVLASEWSEHVTELRKNGLLPESTGDQEDIPLQVIGLPGSIDNDLFGTDMSIGADTASEPCRAGHGQLEFHGGIAPAHLCGGNHGPALRLPGPDGSAGGGCVLGVGA